MCGTWLSFHLRISFHSLELFGHVEISSSLSKILKSISSILECGHGSILMKFHSTIFNLEQVLIYKDGADHSACPPLAPLAVERHHPLPTLSPMQPLSHILYEVQHLLRRGHIVVINLKG